MKTFAIQHKQTLHIFAGPWDKAAVGEAMKRASIPETDRIQVFVRDGYNDTGSIAGRPGFPSATHIIIWD